MKNKLIARLLAQREDDIYGAVRREIERAFDDHGRTWPAAGVHAGKGLRFNVDILETDTTIEVKAEIPGVDAKDVEVQLADGTLIIKGEKRDEKDETRNNYHIVERRYGSFFRALTLPAEVDDSQSSATLEHGTLSVVLQKSHGHKENRKVIPVKAA